jgi:release factor glutamine methyltransferase
MTEGTVSEALQAAQQRIDAVDARVLLCHATGRDASFIIARADAQLPSAVMAEFSALVDRRAAGEPVAYLTGEREFYGRTFKVTPAVLIPRPETELLVDLALERMPRSGISRVLELGTGSGCIAIALASERSLAKIVATDQSLDALAVARRNAFAIHVGNIAFLQSDWFEGLRRERFDVIVSNPPYVATGDPHLGEGDLRYEPRTALDGGSDGLDAVRAIVKGARAYLEPGGWLLFEHGHDQAAKARGLLRDAAYRDIFSARDLAGIERVSGGRLTLVDASQ